jgi:hypothetical protein
MGDNYSKRNEVVRLENEIVIFLIVFGMVHRSPYEGFPKKPPCTIFYYLSLEFNIMS